MFSCVNVLRDDSAPSRAGIVTDYKGSTERNKFYVSFADGSFKDLPAKKIEEFKDRQTFFSCAFSSHSAVVDGQIETSLLHHINPNNYAEAMKRPPMEKAGWIGGSNEEIRRMAVGHWFVDF